MKNDNRNLSFQRFIFLIPTFATFLSALLWKFIPIWKIIPAFMPITFAICAPIALGILTAFIMHMVIPTYKFRNAIHIALLSGFLFVLILGLVPTLSSYFQKNYEGFILSWHLTLTLLLPIAIASIPIFIVVCWLGAFLRRKIRGRKSENTISN